MLKELRPVRQVPGDRPRRWFASDALDLITWSDPDGSTAAFQLCYREGVEERAVVWRRGNPGLEHFEVDGGESRPMSHKATPTLRPAQGRGLAPLIARFRAESEHLEAGVRGLVLESLAEEG